jgi:coniferyl-aldehyde dehydrogenase
VPFGGVGHSGMGSYHGKAGFDTFSHHRAVSESRIPGGMVGQLSPAGFTPQTEQALLGHISSVRQDVLARLGR